MDSFYRTVDKINNLQQQFQRFFSRSANHQKRSGESGLSFRKDLEVHLDAQAEQKKDASKKDTLPLKSSSFARQNLEGNFGENLEKSLEEKKSNIVDLLKQSAKKYELPEELVMSVAKIESGFNEKAISHKGAMGVMQIMPKTAEYLELKNPFSAKENIEAGTKFLKHLTGVYKNDVVKTLAAYNAGEGAVNSKKFTSFKETNDYVKKVMKQYLNYSGLQ